MIRIARKMLSQKGMFSNSVPRALFCSNEKQPKEGGGVSIQEVTEDLKKFGKNVWQQSQKLNRYHWGVIGTITALIYYLSLEKEENYPINLFEEEIFSYEKNTNKFSITKKGFSDVTVLMEITPDKINYKIKFNRNDCTYVVNYKNQLERFMKVQKILDQEANTFKLKYEYLPNSQISTFKYYIFFHIFSTIFITIFFLRSSNVSSSVRKSGTNNLSQMFGQKKKFEVIAKTNVKFKDVAGLD